jgi:hypothetical protein
MHNFIFHWDIVTDEEFRASKSYNVKRRWRTVGEHTTESIMDKYLRIKGTCRHLLRKRLAPDWIIKRSLLRRCGAI